METESKTLALCFLVSEADVPLPAMWAAWLAAGAGAAARGGRNPRARVFVHTASHPPPSATPAGEPALARAAASAAFVPWERTGWGRFGIVRAQQRLFEAALRERDVACCVLLSGDCAPLAPFDAVFEALVGSEGVQGEPQGEPRKSLLAVEPEPLKPAHRAREPAAVRLRDEAAAHADPAAWPEAGPAAWPWRWGVASQWCALQRREAELLAANFAVVEACFDGTHVPDEHAYAVFFRGALGGDAGFDARFERRGPMLVDWDMAPLACLAGLDHADAVGSSPHSFHLADLAPALVRRERASGHLFVRKLCLAALRRGEGGEAAACEELCDRTWRLQ